jgi:hypothetical protein
LLCRVPGWLQDDYQPQRHQTAQIDSYGALGA